MENVAAQFDTDLIKRAEEYKIMLYNDHIWQYYHQLPESASGADLTQDEARTIAQATIKEQFNTNPEELTEISATSVQLPHRKDWLFIFANSQKYPLSIGQARISITIGGDQVTNSIRTIHVPEEWERAEQNKQNMLNIFMIIVALIFLCLMLFALYIIYKQNKSFLFSKRLFWILSGIVFTIVTVDFINSWQTITAGFNTSLPINDQLFQTITGLIINYLMRIVGSAMILSYVLSHKRSHQLPHNSLTATVGICSGFFIAGIYSIIQLLIPTGMPLWPHYEALGYTLPLVANLSQTISYYTQLTVTFSLLFILIDTATEQWQKHCLFFTGFMTAYGMLTIHLPSLDMVGIWIITSALFGWTLLGMYRFIIRYDYALIPLATSGPTLLYIAQEGIFNAYPGALVYACINACIIGIITILWYQQIQKN